MYDKSKVIAGLVVFLALVLSPILLMGGRGRTQVELYREFPLIDGKRPTECVEPTAWMRASHMKLLYSWRDEVVRSGAKVYESKGFPNKKWPDLSLTKTCLKCHTSYDKFCNRCHERAGVRVDCFDCHLVGSAGGR